MMFEVGIVAHFEAAHRLKGDFGPAARLHGHTYRVEVAVRGPSLRDDGTLCDIGLMRQVVDGELASLHYQNLDDLDLFQGRNTTAEVVAQVLWERIAPGLKASHPTSLLVRVWESPQAYASCEGEL